MQFQPRTLGDRKRKRELVCAMQGKSIVGQSSSARKKTKPSNETYIGLRVRTCHPRGARATTEERLQ
jgi:hypothetical protein